jgi:lipopolysaccharide biosynthesis protein
VGLHLHVFYPELLPNLLQRLALNQNQPQLILTLPEGVNQALVERTLAEAGAHSAELRTTPNVGRDIGPLLVNLGMELDERFDLHGHLHTKRSELVDGGVARLWRNFLLSNLLGQTQRPMLDAIVAAFKANPSLGLVFPEDPNALGWSDNFAIAEALAPRLGLPLPLPQNLRFPVGTMFWARRGALRRLYSLGLQWDDLPAEPLGYDGSLLHALERMLPLVAEHAGFTLATTHVPGVTR